MKRLIALIILFSIRNNNEVSFHFAVDDREIVQGIPLERNAWHAGDGNGKGNREGIAIEICYSKSGGDRWLAAINNAARFIAQLLKERNWGIDKVTKHQDYNGKNCPHRILDELGWENFIKMVNEQLNPKPADKPKTKITSSNLYIKVGDIVRVNEGAADYTGTKVVSYIYDNKYRVDSLKGNRAVLDEKGICTAFNVKDLTIVNSLKTTATTQATNPTTAVITGNTVSNHFPKYNGNTTSIVTALNTIGATSSFSYRGKIAKVNGIKDYVGTAKQNITMLNLLKRGKLIKP